MLYLTGKYQGKNIPLSPLRLAEIENNDCNEEGYLWETAHACPSIDQRDGKEEFDFFFTTYADISHSLHSNMTGSHHHLY